MEEQETNVDKKEKSLFEQSCDYIHNLEDLEKDISLRSFMGEDEIMSIAQIYYKFCRDALPKELVEFSFGQLHIGFIIGRMACGDDPDLTIKTDAIDWR